MTEFELKLEIPPSSLPAVATAMRQGKALRQRLQARYFDTEEGTLARHGIVVRLRKEGRKWMQTAKAPGASALERLEHNVPVAAPAPGAAPAVDLARHAGSAVGDAIDHVLKRNGTAAWPALVPLYETDVQRRAQSALVRESTVEVSLDEGHVASGERTAQVSELEIELKDGDAADAVLLARHWCAEFGLWLNTVSKSQKGQRLGAGASFGSVVSARQPDYGRKAGARKVAAAIVGACMEQVLGNASEVGAGSHDADHIHQLRVGIRRLRTALREVGALVDGVDPAWEGPLVDAFRSLGEHRDHSHLERSTQPQLEAAGGPGVGTAKTVRAVPDAGGTVRDARFQDVLLCLAGFAHQLATGDAGQEERDHDARKIIRKRLRKLHAQLVTDSRNFLALDETLQHRVRKRLKRLRYLSEFAAPLFGQKKAAAFIAALKPPQEALGLYNDELTALQAYRQLAGEDSRAWFGVGWLSARRAPNAGLCLQALQVFARARPFWD